MTFAEEQYWRARGEDAINAEMVKRLKVYLASKQPKKPRASNGPNARKAIPFAQSMTYAALQQRLKASA